MDHQHALLVHFSHPFYFHNVNTFSVFSSSVAEPEPVEPNLVF